ncbi:MAG: O-antigen ligase domain-containing protein [Bacteroidetes bacterium]|nr:MAG: O-antigen ligase domain-containing protein [Bacteroidota bacterium]
MKFKFADIYNVYLGLFAGLFFFLPKMVGLLVVLLVLLTLYGGIKKELKFKLTPLFVFPVLLYLAYLTGILFTDHMNLAKGYAENKLAFLILPLIFSFRPQFENRISFPLIGSAAGIVISSIMGIGNAFSCLNDGGLLMNCITSVNISPIHHPTYYATFILVITFGIWWARKREEPYLDLRWVIPFSVFASIIFVLSMSLAAMLCLAILICVLVLRWIKNRFGKKIFWVSTMLSPIVLIFFLSNFPVINDEVNYTKSSIAAYWKGPVAWVNSKPGYKTGNEVRLVMWTVTVLEIVDHPFGVGTGNVDEALSSRLSRHGQLELAKQDDSGSIRYNPHNQFLQTGLELGILGALLLILFIAGAIRKASFYRNSFLMVIGISLVVNAVFESMLQRQSGIIFYMFWICFMVIFAMTDQKRSETR